MTERLIESRLRVGMIARRPPWSARDSMYGISSVHDGGLGMGRHSGPSADGRAERTKIKSSLMFVRLREVGNAGIAQS